MDTTPSTSAARGLLNLLLAALLAALLLLLGTACPGPTGDDDAGDDDSTAADDDDDDDSIDDDDDAADDDDSSPEYDGQVSGTVQDPDGDAIEGLGLTVCSDVRCYNTVTGADGSFSVGGLPPDAWVVHNIGYPGEDPAQAALEWAAFYDIVRLGEDEQFAFDEPLVLPHISETYGELAGNTTLTFSGEMEVHFDADQLTVPFPASDAPELTLGAVEIPESRWPYAVFASDPAFASAVPLGAWAFAPFEVALQDEEQFDVRMAVDGLDALPVGTVVEFWVADYYENILSEQFVVAAASVSEDGLAVEGSVHMLSLLIAVAYPEAETEG
jgi:hypothetical protein